MPTTAIAEAPVQWAIVSAPAANTVATATKAAATGVAHVLTSIAATLSAGAVAPAVVQTAVVVRDGTSGAGTIIWEQVISLTAVAGAMSIIDLSGLELIGTAGNALTVEFLAAGGANTTESVSATGFDQV